MLMQVLSLTPDQINALAESERAAIMQLVSHCYYFYTLVRLMFFFLCRGVSLWARLATPKAVYIAGPDYLFSYKTFLVFCIVIIRYPMHSPVQ